MKLNLSDGFSICPITRKTREAALDFSPAFVQIENPLGNPMLNVESAGRILNLSNYEKSCRSAPALLSEVNEQIENPLESRMLESNMEKQCLKN
jgi:hypothetical protein